MIGCPNTPPCEHSSVVHDIYEPGDPYPACCAEGCRCGHPGYAEIVRHADGTVTVTRADHLIAVDVALLNDAEPWFKQGDVIQLDTAGDRYRYLRRLDKHRLVYERITR